MRTLLPLLLIACGGDSNDSKDGDSAVGEGPYLSDDVSIEVPGFDADGVADAVDTALGLALDVNATPVVSIYDAFMDYTTDDCPQWYTSEDSPYWFDSCTTDAGVTFDGYGLFAEHNGTLDGDGTAYYGYQIYSVGALSAPDGSVLTLTGQADLLYAVNGTVEIFYTNLTDGTAWEGDATGSWLDWGINPGMYVYAVRETTTGARTVQMSGSIRVEDNDIDTVVFDDLYLVDDPSGALCGAEPSGMISILSSDGQWYDLVFDGPEEDNQPVPDEVCDGCATAWFKGEALGEACVDFSALMDWDEAPWE